MLYTPISHTLDTVKTKKYIDITISYDLFWDRHVGNVDNSVGNEIKTFSFSHRNPKDRIKM